MKSPRINRTLLFLTFLYASFVFAQGSLNLFIEKQRYGFINENGDKVVPTQYFDALPFSEGLAAVRTSQGYGYIDTTGQFVIPPQFDDATSFMSGTARVTIDQHPFFILPNGKKAFDTESYETVNLFYHNRSIVVTASGKYGAIDQNGNLVIDTAFSKIEPFEGAATRAYGLQHNPWGDNKTLPRKTESTLIDTNGRLLYPYEAGYKAQRIENGYFEVDVPQGSDDKNITYADCVMDPSGEILLKIPISSGVWINEIMEGGIVKVYFRKKYNPKTKKFEGTADNAQGFMDLNGNVLLFLENVSFIRDFHQNRAFISMRSAPYKVIDQNYNILPFDDFRIYNYVDDENCFARVQKTGEWEWFYIDTMGQKITYTPDSAVQRFDDLAILKDEFKDSTGKTREIYYLADQNGTVISEPFTDYNRKGFYGGLLLCDNGKKQFYLNRKGKKVWETPTDDNAYPLNINYQQRAAFYASSAMHFSDIGGFGGSSNAPQRSDNIDISKGIFIEVDTARRVDQNYLYHRVELMNYAPNPTYFSAQDSRLYMIIQAQAENGEWRDIQYLPGSWCGNSYHTLTLESGEYWAFKIPVFDGPLSTKCRIKLTHFGSEKDRENVIYSNTFNTNINPSQFWKKQGYTPQGIMDPYND